MEPLNSYPMSNALLVNSQVLTILYRVNELANGFEGSSYLGNNMDGETLATRTSLMQMELKKKKNAIYQNGKAAKHPGLIPEVATGPNKKKSQLLKNFKVQKMKAPVKNTELFYDMQKMKNELKQIRKIKGGINVTMVAEKPSVARTIAAVLSRGEHETSEWEGTKTHVYHGEFLDQPAYFSIVSVYGHLYK